MFTRCKAKYLAPSIKVDKVEKIRFLAGSGGSCSHESSNCSSSARAFNVFNSDELPTYKTTRTW